jgi:hypothetical protein
LPDISGKGLITRIYRELNKLTPQRINNPLNKWANELNRQFPKEELQMANEFMKKCSIFLVKKAMQIKTMLRFYLTSVRMAMINNTNYKC